MLFHTPVFSLFFLVFLCIYCPLKRTRFATCVIAAFSLFFYGYWNWRYLFLLFITILFDFYIGRIIENEENRKKRKMYLCSSLIVNISILVYFKYWNFFIDSLFLGSEFSAHIKTAILILPLGISFYIFQSISYVVDVYRKRIPAVKNLIDYTAFITFFPHLIAGPIQRGWQLIPQVIKPDGMTAWRIFTGIFLFCRGFFLKSLGDMVAMFHDPVFANISDANPVVLIFSLFTFGIQIYVDFAGYSEMAIGIARVIGIDISKNFEEPYLSTSVQEFWRKWHISLSSWIRDYLYISLGGNREGFGKQIINVVIVMAICGLWHGAGWGFFAWGIIHGILLASNLTINHFISDWNKFHVSPKMVSAGGWLLTYLTTNYAWLFFRVTTWSDVVLAHHKIMQFFQSPGFFVLSAVKAIPPGLWIIFPLVFIFDITQRRVNKLLAGTNTVYITKTLGFSVLSAILFCFALILNVGAPTQQFIYFQF